MADRFGTRRVFSSAIGLFTLGSFLCGLSTNIHILVACRIIQGAGGAMMVPVGRLTLVRTFPKFELVRAMSFVAIPGLIGPHAGTRRRRLDRRLSDGVEMTNIKQVVPIGVGCRLCPWQVPLPDCAFHSKSLSVSALRR